MLSVKWGKNAFACRSEYEEGICMNHQKCNNIYLDLYIVVQGCNLFIFLSIYFSILNTLLLNNHVNMMQNSKNKSKHTIFTFEIQIVSSYYSGGTNDNNFQVENSYVHLCLQFTV